MTRKQVENLLMLSSGITALVVFLITVYSVIYISSVRDNKMFIHLMGIIEGVVISLFSYFFTKSQKEDKDVN